jgi:hypothetical protein
MIMGTSRHAPGSFGVYKISSYFVEHSRRTELLPGYSRMRENEIREGIRRLSQVL